MMTIYRGDTVRIEAYHYDYDGTTLITPGSWTVTIFDPNGVGKGTYTTPTLISTGYYYQTHTTAVTDTAGQWTVRWKSMISGTFDSEEIKFNVLE